MVDFRPLNALRYDTAVAGPAETLVSPPYDVVSAEEAAALYAKSPYNIARIDFGPIEAGDTDEQNRYTRARRDLDAWRAAGVVKRDETPTLYVYDQEFELDGERLTRRSVFGKLRLEDWDTGNILPHEHTGAAAKEDRRRLLYATNTHLSPIMAMYNAPAAAHVITDDVLEAPVFDAVLPDQRHTLRPIKPDAAAAFAEALADERLYIADGHHRYETALGYRNVKRDDASSWTDEEPENFVLAALVDANDPGLVVLPIHRLVKLANVPSQGRKKLAAMYDIESTASDNLERLMAALEIAGDKGGAFGVIGLEKGKLDLLLPKDEEAIDALVPHSKPPVWRKLDVAILHNAVLPSLGFEESPQSVVFTEDHEEVAEEVAKGDWDLGILLNPTRVEQIIAVADAGERMPQKSTFFFPKLGTGILMLPIE